MNTPARLRRFDVCNGDADGLCAVLQGRLHDPAPAQLVTSLKREIELLQHLGEAIRHADPFQLIAADRIVRELGWLLRDDPRRATRVVPALRIESSCLVVLPDAPWARRAIGTLANELAAAAAAGIDALAAAECDRFIAAFSAMRCEPRAPGSRAAS